MNLELYAQLHGLIKQTPKLSEAEDPEFEAALSRYIDHLLEQEKEGFQEGLVLLPQHLSRLRLLISQNMHAFLKSFRRGYQTLSGVLTEEEKANLLEKRENLVQNPRDYTLLGFSPALMTRFYKKGCNLIGEGEFEQARDAFYFLVVLAPKISHFWLALGICYSNLNDYELAVQATMESTKWAPHQLSSYTHGVRLFMQHQEVEKALHTCEKGLAAGLEPEDNDLLDKVKKQITQVRGAL